MPGDDSIQRTFLDLRASLARAVMSLVPPKEVEDIVQETYVRVCQIDQSSRETSAQRSFLFKTARNLALDYLRRAETRLTSSIDEDLLAETAEDTGLSGDKTFEQVASREEFSLFCEAVRHLPVQCRRAFVLKKVYGYTQAEIARELEISENTVEKHIAQGIKRCTFYMQQYDAGYVRPEKRTRKSKNAVANEGSGRGARGPHEKEGNHG